MNSDQIYFLGKVNIEWVLFLIIVFSSFPISLLFAYMPFWMLLNIIKCNRKLLQSLWWSTCSPTCSSGACPSTRPWNNTSAIRPRGCSSPTLSPSTTMTDSTNNKIANMLQSSNSASLRTSRSISCKDRASSKWLPNWKEGSACSTWGAKKNFLRGSSGIILFLEACSETIRRGTGPPLWGSTLLRFGTWDPCSSPRTLQSWSRGSSFTTRSSWRTSRWWRRRRSAV